MTGITGTFSPPPGTVTLPALTGSVEALSRLPALHHVEAVDGGQLRAVFTPDTPFGRVPFQLRIVVDHADGRRAALRVHGRRGPHVVDVELTAELAAGAESTELHWTADVAVRGPAASAGRRVALDVAGRAIGDAVRAVAS